MPASAEPSTEGPAQAPPIAMIPMGDDATIARIIDEGKNRNQVMQHLSHISLEIGPRLTGSTNAEKANRWTMDRFAAWGLSNPHLEQWGTVSARFDRGPSTGRVILKRDSTDKEGKTVTEDVEVARLDFTTLAWVRGTDGPVRGPVVLMPRTDEEFEAVKDRLAGAWLLIVPERGSRQAIPGMSGSMRGRASEWAEIRKRLADPAALAAAIEARRNEAEEAAAKAAAPDDGLSGPWKGVMTGSRAPEGTPATLDLEKAPDGSVTGTMSIGEYSSGPIKDAKLDGQTLTFTRASARGGERHYTLKIDSTAMSGQGVMEEGDASPYTLTLQRGARDVPPIPEGPSLEERILMANPAGFISGSRDERVWTDGASGWRDLDIGALSPDLEVSVSLPQFEAMRALLAGGASLDAEFNLRHTFSKGPEGGPVPVYNTVAEIPGTQWPEQVVIVSGHLDSWNGPGSTGTCDNGTGSSVTLEAARILMAAGARPKRTIRFILWTGEEQGLFGSRGYVEQHADEMANISCVLVDDGGTNYEGGLGAADAMIPMLANATAPVNDAFYSETDGHWMNVNIRSTGPTLRQPGGSDHMSFNAVGVPGFFWDEIGRDDYDHIHHTQFDRLDTAIPEYLVQSSTCAAVTAYNLACAPTLLPRDQPDAPAANTGK
jgi:hypothetical protein